MKWALVAAVAMILILLLRIESLKSDLASEQAAHEITKAAHNLAVIESKAQAEAYAAVQERKSANIAAVVRAETDRLLAESATSTQARKETIRNVIRTIPTPVVDPVALPVPNGVRLALDQARADAAAANGRLRAGLYRRLAASAGYSGVNAADVYGLGRMGKRNHGRPDARADPARWRTRMLVTTTSRGRYPVREFFAH